jgi:predicted HTH transcriptional regulator
LAQGEGEALEFKSSARWDYREQKVNKTLEQVIVKTLASFLNGKGGTLLIGVDDGGAVLGLETDYGTLGKRPDRDGYQQFLVQLVSGTLGKNICADLSISFHPVQGKEICLIRSSASASPVYLDDQGQSKLFVRLGNTSQELTGRHAVDYVRSRWPGKA